MRFRVTDVPELGAAAEIDCSRCAHRFVVAVTPQNYFFTCSVCHEVGNLPGVLLAQADREFQSDLTSGAEERWIARCQAIENFLVHPASKTKG